MDKILQLNNLQIKDDRASSTNLVNKLDKLVSQSEYGKDFCKQYYHKDYIDGLIDTVKNDFNFAKSDIAKAQRALKSHNINVKNRYLKSKTNKNLDEYIGYDSDQIKDANHDIKENIHEQKLILKQLNQYTPNTVVEESGNFDNCIHPLKYSRVKYLLNYDYNK